MQRENRRRGESLHFCWVYFFPLSLGCPFAFYLTNPSKIKYRRDGKPVPYRIIYKQQDKFQSDNYIFRFYCQTIFISSILSSIRPVSSNPTERYKCFAFSFPTATPVYISCAPKLSFKYAIPCFSASLPYPLP